MPKLLRKQTDPANPVSSLDAAAMIHYAYGEQNGVVQTPEGDVSITWLRGQLIHIGRGRVSLYGWEVEIYPQEIEVPVWVKDGGVYLEIDTNRGAVRIYAKAVSGKPPVVFGDDIRVKNGIASLLLCSFTSETSSADSAFYQVNSVTRAIPTIFSVQQYINFYGLIGQEEE